MTSYNTLLTTRPSNNKNRYFPCFGRAIPWLGYPKASSPGHEFWSQFDWWLKTWEHGPVLQNWICPFFLQKYHPSTFSEGKKNATTHQQKRRELHHRTMFSNSRGAVGRYSESEHLEASKISRSLAKLRTDVAIEIAFQYQATVNLYITGIDEYIPVSLWLIYS